MKNFKQGGKFSGNRGSSSQDLGRKGFRDRNSGSRDFGGRDRGEDRPMYDAICSECGKRCEVPFKPSGDKPVYCNSCFEGKKGGESRGFEKRESRGSSFGNRPERQMFSAKCDKCGNNCEVPFKPSGDKPIYCNDCFGKNNDRGERSDRGGRDFAGKSDDGQLKNQIDALHTKLDKILKLLSPVPEMVELPAPAKKEVKMIEPKKVAKIAQVASETEKVVTKKPVAKKVATKKKK